MRRDEQGAALLTVLMLVAVIAVLAAASLEKLRLSTRLATNMAAIEQARAYGLAAETLAVLRIGDLLSRDAAKTTLAGDWLGRATPVPIDNGQAFARVADGGNCFNLNALVSGAADTGYTIRPTAITQFEALMTVLNVPRPAAQRIALATADWIDTDSAPAPGGAEDESYDGYRTANTLMADPSELRAVTGVTAEIYGRVRPWVCALPVAELSPINVNTLLPEQAPLVAMLLPGRITLDQARKIIDARPRDGYASMVDFWKLPALAGETPSPDVLAQPQLKTRWFTLDVDVALAGAELRQVTLIDGALAPARAVRRSYGDPS